MNNHTQAHSHNTIKTAVVRSRVIFQLTTAIKQASRCRIIITSWQHFDLIHFPLLLPNQSPQNQARNILCNCFSTPITTYPSTQSTIQPAIKANTPPHPTNPKTPRSRSHPVLRPHPHTLGVYRDRAYSIALQSPSSPPPTCPSLKNLPPTPKLATELLRLCSTGAGIPTATSTGSSGIIDTPRAEAGMNGDDAGVVVGERERKVCGVGMGAGVVTEAAGARERKVKGGGMRRVPGARG